MIRSAICERARFDAFSSNNDGGAKELLKLLDLPIASFEVKKIEKRILALNNLFDSLDNQQAENLFNRLKDQNDPLAKFYRCELETKFREKLLFKLKKNIKGFSDVPLNRAIDNRATNNPTTVRTTPPKTPKTPTVDSPPPKTIKDIKIFDPPPKKIQKPKKIEKIIEEAKKVLKRLEDSGSFAISVSLDLLIDQAESLFMTVRLASTGLAISLVFLGGGLYIINKYGVLISIVEDIDFLVDFLLKEKGDRRYVSRILTRLIPKLQELEKTITEIEKITQNEQPRDSKGRFKSKPNSDTPGSSLEKTVCDLVQDYYPYHARQVGVKRYAQRSGFPNQQMKAGLVLVDPKAKVDCIGSFSRTKNLILFDAKSTSFAPLQPNQKIVYPKLTEFGGEIVSSNQGSFKIGTKIPKGTIVRIITPFNLQDIYTP